MSCSLKVLYNSLTRRQLKVTVVGIVNNMAQKSKVLKGVVCAIAGTISVSHKEFEELLIAHGGELSASVSQRVTHVISTKEEVEANTPKIKKAIKEEIPIVSESFIRNSIARGKLQEQERYYLDSDVYRESKNSFIDDDDDYKDGLVSEPESPSSSSDEDAPPQKRKRSSSGTVKVKKQKREATPKSEKTQTPKKPMISSEDFMAKANPLAVEIDRTNKKTRSRQPSDFVKLEAAPKVFSTGSLGWNIGGKVVKVVIEGYEVTANISANLVIRGSKPKPEKPKDAEGGDSAEATDSTDAPESQAEPEEVEQEEEVPEEEPQEEYEQEEPEESAQDDGYSDANEGRESTPPIDYYEEEPQDGMDTEEKPQSGWCSVQ